MARVYALGSINADFQLRVPRPLQAGETLLGTDFLRLSGGKAANIAFMARRLGHEAVLLGRVGEDDLREQALSPLRKAGIDLAQVSVARGQSTAVSMIAVPPDGKKSITLASNANDAWDDDAVEAMAATIAAAPAPSMLVADYEIPARVVARAVEAACDRGLPVILDPASAERAEPRMLARCLAIAPDAREAGELTGLAVENPGSAGRAAGQLARLGTTLVCVKLGDGGCVYALCGRLGHIPPVPIDVVDATGAGDAFTGALAVALLEGQPAEQAVLFATAASHLAVTRYGSQDSFAGREETEALAARLAENRRPLAL